MSHLLLNFIFMVPVTSSSVIKTVQVDQYTNCTNVTPTKREQRYTVTPNPQLLMQMMILDLMKRHHFFKMQKHLTLLLEKTNYSDLWRILGFNGLSLAGGSRPCIF